MVHGGVERGGLSELRFESVEESSRQGSSVAANLFDRPN